MLCRKTKDKKHLRNAFTSIVRACVPMLPAYLKTNRTVLSERATYYVYVLSITCKRKKKIYSI